MAVCAHPRRRARASRMLTAMPRHRTVSLCVTLALAALSASSAFAQIDFGDNASLWANDGECDDPRFEGEGAADTLLDEDRGHDADDCRMLFEAGRIRLRVALPGTITTFDGRLEEGDDTLTTGEYYDGYELEGEPGQRLVIDLRSLAFDTYLILVLPSGEQIENDDADGDDDVGHSRIDTTLTEAGTYRVYATSYESGETGPYSLTIDTSGSTTHADAGLYQASLENATAAVR
jgi:hypothetical protein